MNKDVYRSAMSNLAFQKDFEDTVAQRMANGEQPKPLNAISRIPVTVRRAMEFAAVAACLVLVALFVSPLLKNTHLKLPHSSGDVSVRVVNHVDLKEQPLPPFEAMTEEQLFDRADTVFSGTVESIETLEIEVGKEVSYRSVITVTADRVWRGMESPGAHVRILLPFAIDTKNVNTKGVLSQLRTGMQGIFLAEALNEESLYLNADGSLALMDIAPYALSDDRSAFLAGENSVIYLNDAFPSLKVNPTFDEVSEYVTTMLGNNLTTTTVTSATMETTETTIETTSTTVEKITTKPITTSRIVSDATKTATPTTPAYSGPLASDYYYYISIIDRVVYRVTEDGNQEAILEWGDSNILQVFPDGEWLYYVAFRGISPQENDGLYRCRADGSNRELVRKDWFFEPLIFEGDRFVFLNKSTLGGVPFTQQGQSIYTMNKDGSNLREVYVLSGGWSNGFATDDQYAYIVFHHQDTSKEELLRISLSDGSHTSLKDWGDGTDASQPKNQGYLYVEEGWVYYYENVIIKEESGSQHTVCNLKRIRIDGSGEVLLVEDTIISGITVHDGCLYFIHCFDRTNKNDGLYSMPVDGPFSPQLVATPFPTNDVSTDITSFKFKNNYLYYSYSNYYVNYIGLCRMNLDSRNIQKIYQVDNWLPKVG